ncbi:hypothetical protein SVIO_046290 [Streptomyces violaceusniger]|uniref:Uncharacterized protein n=1 Tax=Streptomyces violaceusniger TaxID=68280 RepID=A0A4D4L4A5_STRVO|nr:hypothetical protein SVIO_046290 [Streptomyces violaceusniger]
MPSLRQLRYLGVILWSPPAPTAMPKPLRAGIPPSFRTATRSGSGAPGRRRFRLPRSPTVSFGTPTITAVLPAAAEPSWDARTVTRAWSPRVLPSAGRSRKGRTVLGCPPFQTRYEQVTRAPSRRQESLSRPTVATPASREVSMTTVTRPARFGTTENARSIDRSSLPGSGT